MLAPAFCADCRELGASLAAGHVDFKVKLSCWLFRSSASCLSPGTWFPSYILGPGTLGQVSRQLSPEPGSGYSQREKAPEGSSCLCGTGTGLVCSLRPEETVLDPRRLVGPCRDLTPHLAHQRLGAQTDKTTPQVVGVPQSRTVVPQSHPDRPLPQLGRGLASAFSPVMDSYVLALSHVIGLLQNSVSAF